MGKVYLVGAGPGDPGLITQKGLKILRKADVVIYDNLVNPELLRESPQESEKIYVGKKAGKHTLRQEKINQLLVEKARENAMVVRLKGGDPYVFGRGAEEALALEESGIPFEVVPGVTAGVAALGYAGIPATVRGFDSSLTFVTGHEDPTKRDSDINWASLAQEKSTLVFYMGVGHLPEIVEQLLKNGKPPETPAALVRRGTLPDQRVVEGTLKTIVEKVREAKMTPPALIVVGEVIRLRSKLAWFERLPLAGTRIVVTRARHQASALGNRLRENGAEVHLLPTIRISDPDSWLPVDQVFQKEKKPDWLVFTSENGVRQWMKRLFANGMDVRWLGPVKIASMGSGTSAALKEFGLVPDLEPKTFVAEGLVDAFRSIHLKDQTVVLARAAEARDVLPQELKKMGAAVAEVTVYRTLVDEQSRVRARELFREKQNFPDWITFTSSSTVKNFVRLVGEERIPEISRTVKVASIGPITTQTAQKFGFRVTVEPEQFTIRNLVEALVAYEKKH
ncbi:MAG: uroporphyrinogen-III C-methyltransferase [Calditrichaeota bacterium]|nr:uroporphyrinogen-III C-methyltransferase [Calditrichota bacterium]